MTDLEAAWDEIHDAEPTGWFVGPPTHEEHRHEWTMYAFDTRERAKHGPPVARVDGRRAVRA